MKLKKTSLLSALTLPALLAFGTLGAFGALGTTAGAPADKVAFQPTAGLALTRTFTTTNEMVLDDMSMNMDGQPAPMNMEMEMNMNMQSTIEVLDEFLTVEEGRVKKLKRSFDQITSTAAVSASSPMMPENMDQTIDSASELEGETVIFTWNEDDGTYVASFPDDGGDVELLEELEQDMDMSALLPAGEVAEGDTWEIEPNELKAVLMPGGNLSLMPDEDDMPEGFPGMDSMSGMNDMLGDLEGEATGEYRGTREVDGITCAVIGIRIAITSAADLTEKMAEAMDQMPEGMSVEMDHIDIEMEMEGEGVLLWNLAAGHAHAFELSASVSSIMDMGMNVDAGGRSMSMEQTMEMSGSFDFAVQVTKS